MIDDERTWLSVPQACDSVASGKAHGVGFAIGGGVVGIDLDGCIDADGTLHEIACDALALDTYAETSPSARGMHLWIRATIYEPRKLGARKGAPGREIYDGRKDSARFFTVTGNRVGDALELREGPQAQAALDAFIAKWFPQRAERVEADDDTGIDDGQPDDNRLLQVMFGAKDGARWRAIFDGAHSGYPSQSEADFALCRKLRFYTHGNAAQMDRVFRGSRLMRKKWDEKHGIGTYGQITIAAAIAKGGPFYAPRDHESDAKKRDTWERKAWAKVPAWVFIRLGGVGELACRAYGVIVSYANEKGHAWPSVQTIAAHLRVSERRVKTAIAKLKAAGLMTSTRQSGTSNLYRLTLTVPETITPYAMRRAAPRVMESGHLWCYPHGTITNQEPTNIDTGEGAVTALKRCGIKDRGEGGHACKRSAPVYPSVRGEI